jgi:hypothetical protein
MGLDVDAAPPAPAEGRGAAPQRPFREVLEAQRSPPAPPSSTRPRPAAARPAPAAGPAAPSRLLRTAGPPRAVAPAVARAVQARVTVEGLQRARAGHDAEAARRGEVRGEALGAAAQAGEVRAHELLRQALLREPDPCVPRPGAAAPPAPPAPREERAGAEAAAPGTPGGARGEAATPQPAGASPGGEAPARAEALLALVERIDAFVRAGRPALALEVGGALGARVELERTGPGEVALTLRPRGAPPAAAELEALRRAVEGRGLRLSRLVLGPRGQGPAAA